MKQVLIALINMAKTLILLGKNNRTPLVLPTPVLLMMSNGLTVKEDQSVLGPKLGVSHIRSSEINEQTKQCQAQRNPTKPIVTWSR